MNLKSKFLPPIYDTYLGLIFEFQNKYQINDFCIGHYSLVTTLSRFTWGGLVVMIMYGSVQVSILVFIIFNLHILLLTLKNEFKQNLIY